MRDWENIFEDRAFGVVTPNPSCLWIFMFLSAAFVGCFRPIFPQRPNVLRWNSFQWPEHWKHQVPVIPSYHHCQMPWRPQKKIAEWEKINLMVKRKSEDRFCWHGGFPHFCNWIVFHLSQTGSPEYQLLQILSMIYKLKRLENPWKEQGFDNKGHRYAHVSDWYIHISIYTYTNSYLGYQCMQKNTLYHLYWISASWARQQRSGWLIYVLDVVLPSHLCRVFFHDAKERPLEKRGTNIPSFINRWIWWLGWFSSASTGDMFWFGLHPWMKSTDCVLRHK